MLEQPPFSLIGAAVFGMQLLMLTKVLQSSLAAARVCFMVGNIRQLMLCQFGNQVVLGLGQTVSGRVAAAVWQSGVLIGILWCFGKYAVWNNPVLAIEHFFNR
jgi:hypothetical protein